MLFPDSPASEASSHSLFGTQRDFSLPVFAPHPLTPVCDPAYQFDPGAVEAICAAFAYNRRLLLYGMHGTGKSTHIEQVAARLNWPLIRLNFDEHIGRFELMGRDVITLREGKQVSLFEEGLLPYCVRRPVALVLDEYDAARPEALFVFQQLLEQDGKLLLLEKNETIKAHPFFRLFATANTAGMGDEKGLYHGVHALNQGQLDRWPLYYPFTYLPEDKERALLSAKLPRLRDQYGDGLIESMVRLANLLRKAFESYRLAVSLSPRTLLYWGENTLVFNDPHHAFVLTYLYRCNEAERDLCAELYQRVFNHELAWTQKWSKDA